MNKDQFMNIYKSKLNYVKRMIKYAEEDDNADEGYRKYFRGYLEGCKGVLSDILYECDVTEIITYKSPTDDDHTKYKRDENEFFTLERIYCFNDIEYPVFNDDYGQCFSLKLGKEFYSLGTYNLAIEFDVIMSIISYEFDQAI